MEVSQKGKKPKKYTIILRGGSAAAEVYSEALRDIFGFTSFYPDYLESRGGQRLIDAEQEVIDSDRAVINASDMADEEFNDCTIMKTFENAYIWECCPVTKTEWDEQYMHIVKIPSGGYSTKLVEVISKLIKQMNYWSRGIKYPLYERYAIT